MSDGAFSEKLVNDFLAVNYFCDRTSEKLNWVLNTSLRLSSNVIWHAYRLIVETKIFRLGVSVICLLYVNEEWTVQKYITERYNILIQIPTIFRHIYNK